MDVFIPEDYVNRRRIEKQAAAKERRPEPIKGRALRPTSEKEKSVDAGKTGFRKRIPQISQIPPCHGHLPSLLSCRNEVPVAA
ncbi:hypothetical protein SDJN03_03427, partial [Cucurbita argyrosperma subsp. sororia]